MGHQKNKIPKLLHTHTYTLVTRATDRQTTCIITLNKCHIHLPEVNSDSLNRIKYWTQNVISILVIVGPKIPFCFGHLEFSLNSVGNLFDVRTYFWLFQNISKYTAKLAGFIRFILSSNRLACDALKKNERINITEWEEKRRTMIWRKVEKHIKKIGDQVCDAMNYIFINCYNVIITKTKTNERI